MKRKSLPILLILLNAFFCKTINAQAPANDECSGAITVTTNPFGSGCTSAMPATTVSATASSSVPVCAGNTADDDIWYSFVANSQSVIIRINNALLVPSGVSASMSFSIYSGNCGSFTSLLCVNGFAFNAGYKIVDGLATGNTYYLRFWTNTITNAATFNFCIQDVPAPPCK